MTNGHHLGRGAAGNHRAPSETDTLKDPSNHSLRQALAATEAECRLLRGVLDAIPIAVFLADADGKLVAKNRAADEIWGGQAPLSKSVDDYSVDYRAWWPHTGHPVGAKEWGLVRALSHGEHCMAEEMEIEALDGQRKVILNYAMPILDDQGLLAGGVAVNVDITERRRVAVILENERRLLRTLIDEIPDFIYVKDINSRFIAANTAVARAMGARSSGELLGKTDADFYPEELAEEYRADEVRIFRTGRPLINKNEPHTVGGQERCVLTSKVPLRDAAGKIVGLVGISRDITERKLAEEELARAKAEAERANAAKSQFLASMSHDLRTPMNAILGMAELALAEDMSPAVRDSLETIQESGETLLELLNGILDLSRIEAGMLEWESAPFSLRSVVEKTLKALNLRAYQKGLEVICDIHADVPDQALGDPLRLRQVLTNLAGNAIKFHAHGEVAVRVAVEARHEDAVCLRFTVRDTGIGISPEALERIFEPFVQGDAATARHFGGTGLGLTISKKLTELAGGRIWATSQLGAGSHFHFVIPFEFDRTIPPAAEVQESSSVSCPLTAPRPPRTLQILLAEDTEANQKLVMRILAKRGHSVEIACNGQQAVEILQQKPFDLVLMDVQMPIMDGFEATEAIRALGEPSKARVPIVAMTAHALVGDRQRCLTAGMDAYLAKPIEICGLIRLVEELANGKRGHGERLGERGP